jgi:hypothetical protein
VKELSEKNLKKKKEGFFFFPFTMVSRLKGKEKKKLQKKKKTKGMIFYFDKNHFSIPSLETKKQLETSYFTGYYL